jgi:hypothetical protein
MCCGTSRNNKTHFANMVQASIVLLSCALLGAQAAIEADEITVRII